MHAPVALGVLWPSVLASADITREGRVPMAEAAEHRTQEDSFPWWMVLIEGILSLVIGVFLITEPGATTLVLVKVLGIYWLVVGILSIVRIFTKTTDAHWGWLLVWGVLGILAGLATLDHPFLATILVPTVLVIFMGVNGIVMGIIALVEAFRGGGWGAGILGGLSILLGIVLLMAPLIGALVLPIVLGVLTIVGGVAAIVRAFRARKA